MSIDFLGKTYNWGSVPLGGLVQTHVGQIAGGVRPAVSVPYTVPTAPPVTPVSPTFDPKIEANTLYGKPMALFAGGFARIGASPAPIVGPYINGSVVDFIVSFGVAVPVDGDRKIYAIYLDNELAWSSVGGGTLPGHGTFAAESFDFIFKPGTLTQTVCSLETAHFAGDENAYRPEMILQIRNLPFARFMSQTGKPVPYVACGIGDVTDGADPADGINLGTALERIAHSPWANYTTSTFEAVDIGDVVDAILIKDNFTVVELCQTVTRTYRNIDLIQSNKLYLKDRGPNVTADFVFDRDTIISDNPAIQVSRAGATEQYRELELIAIDPDQDYTPVPSLSKIPRDPFVISAAVGKETITSPLVIDANTRQALVTFAQQYEENARRTIALRVRAIGYEVEPADLIALTDIADDFDNEVFKVTQTTHGANYEVELEAQAILRCAIPQVADPYFGQVILLLHCDGANGATSFPDSSSFANTMTRSGNAQVSSTSRFGTGSLLCDGTGDGLTSQSNNTLQDIGLSPTNTSPYTIECWARFDAINRVQILVAVDQGLNARFFRLKQNGDDELMFEWSTTNGATFDASVSTSGANLVTDTWYFIAVDKDSTGKIRIYVDGVMRGSDTPAASVIAITTAAMSVGSSGLAAGSSFQGRLEEVRITRGQSRYGAVHGDSSFTPPSDPFPDA